MCQFKFRLIVALLTFGIGILGVSLWIIKSSSPQISIKKVEQFEPEIRGYNEVVSAMDGSDVTIQGLIDEKGLCLDVNDSQPSVCAISLIGSSVEDKFISIRLKTCNEQIKSNCIDLHNLDMQIRDIRIYDNNSNLIDFHLQNKFTGKVSVSEGKGRFEGTIEKIESPINLKEWRPAKYGELIIGESTFEDMIRALGKPLSSDTLAHQDEPKPLIGHYYGKDSERESSGRLTVVVDSRINRIVSISLSPENMTRKDLIKSFGNTFVETGYKFCEGFPESAPVYESQDNPELKYIEYRYEGISISMSNQDKVGEIYFGFNPMGLTSKQDCDKELQKLDRATYQNKK